MLEVDHQVHCQSRRACAGVKLLGLHGNHREAA